jgi:hypothetical protein
MNADDESAITEVTIQPDGRIFVFGMSREVAEVLEQFCPAEHPIRQVVSNSSSQVHRQQAL